MIFITNLIRFGDVRTIINSYTPLIIPGTNVLTSSRRMVTGCEGFYTAIGQGSILVMLALLLRFVALSASYLFCSLTPIM